jgi:O-antigen/teichoic acid export membrane protein
MKFTFRGLEFSLLKEMAVFTFFIFLNQIIDQVNWAVDKFLLVRMIGPAMVTIYSVGAQINSLYIQMSTAVSSVFIPKVNHIVADSDDNQALTNLMTKVGRIQYIILALILTGFVFFGKPFIGLWAGAGKDQAYDVALLLMVPVTVSLIQNLGIEIQRAKNMHRARSVVYACLAAGNVVLSIFLIPQWGCVGAAAGTAISLVLGNILFMNWYYHKKIGLDMRYFWKEILRLLPATVAVCLFGLVYTYFVRVSGWMMLALSAAVFAVVYAAMMWLLGLNSYEKQLFKKMLYKLSRVK